MRIIFFCFLFFCLGFCLSGEFEDIDAKSEDADAVLDKFEDQLAWFLDYVNPIHQADRTHENDDEDRYFEEKRARDYASLVQAINRAEKAFFVYRDKVAQSIGATLGESRHAYYLHSRTELELTLFHTEYLKKRLFPEGWQDKYEHSLKSKKSIPESKSEN